MMNSLFKALSMGGYAQFVWPAYAIVFSAFILNIMGCRWQKKRIQKSLVNWFKRTSSE